MQTYRVFFGENDPLGMPEPTLDERLWAVSRENPDCAYSKFIGNEKSVRKLQAAACDALSRPDHLCRELAFALFGPASAGKTTLARLHANVLELPFIEISPKSVKDLDDVFRIIESVLEQEGIPLVSVVREGYYVLPPCIIFLDEVHALSNSVVQGLLKATEYKDAMMVTESRKTVNCFNVCWIIATTDEGRLFDAFRTRFSPVNLTYLTKAEIAKIVKLDNPDFPDEVCELVAHYNSRVPRKALEFARFMKLLSGMGRGSWERIAREVAEGEGIDELGMHGIHLTILKALGMGPVARNRMVNVAGKKSEELEKFVMPWLLTDTEDQPALVVVTNKGYTITAAGLLELDKRGIKHRGSEVLPKVA